ncbi:hypothetical protein ES703_74341 [subsurface metagenome]
MEFSLAFPMEFILALRSVPLPLLLQSQNGFLLEEYGKNQGSEDQENNASGSHPLRASSSSLLPQRIFLSLVG